MFSRSHLPKVLLYAAALTVGSRRCLAQCLRSDHGKRCQGMWWLERCRRCVSPAKMEIPAACFQRPTSVSAPTPNFYLTPMLKHEIRIQKTCDVRSCKLPLGKEYRAGSACPRYNQSKIVPSPVKSGRDLRYNLMDQAAIVAQLASNVFDDAVRHFDFVCFQVCLPKEFLRCRLQLLIEYNRLLAWGDVVGLIGARDAIQVASSLGSDPIKPCSMISHIGSLLQKFGDWEDTIQSRSAAIEDVAEERLAVVDERTTATSLIQQVSSNIIDTYDQRVRWNAVDDGVFDELLKDIHRCTEGLHQLFDKLHEQRIYETTAKMYREMVILSNEFGELEAMSDAVKRILRFTADEEGAIVTSYDRIHENFFHMVGDAAAVVHEKAHRTRHQFNIRFPNI